MVMLVDDCPRCGSQKIAFDVNGLNCTRVYNALGGVKHTSTRSIVFAESVIKRQCFFADL